MNHRLTILWVFFLFLASCVSEPPPEVDEVNVRIKEEPDRLQPLLSKTGVAQQIESKIFMPLLSVDPVTLQLAPALSKEVPVVEAWSNEGGRIKFELRGEAQWPNGKAVRAEDVAFSLKAVFLPGMEQSSLRAYLDKVDSIAVYGGAVEFFLKERYILSLPAVGSLNILPAYYYDAKDKLSKYSYEEIRKMEKLPEDLSSLVDRMTGATYSRDSIRGSGPYQLTTWEAGQYLELQRVENWWGEEVLEGESYIPFENRVKRLRYQIIPDEAAALQLFRRGALDVLADVSPLQVREFLDQNKEDSQFELKLVDLLQQYVVYLNLEDEILQSQRVREALAHMIDREQFISDVLQGFGEPAHSPIHPSKPFYDPDVKKYRFNLGVADRILEEEGWLDVDGDGLREKMVGGQKRDLEVKILITGSSLSETIALRLQEAGEKVGMGIEIQQMPFSNILKQMRSGDYQLTPLSIKSSPFPYDPYQSWHTDRIGAGGSNFTRFGNDSTDAIIERLRSRAQPEDALEDYRDFQEVFVETLPVLFLAAPQMPVLVRGEYDLPVSALKPGYFENAIILKSSNDKKAQ